MLEKDDKIGDYSLTKFLGRGQFGEVWLGEKTPRLTNGKLHHALKFIFNNDEEVDLSLAKAEVDTWIKASGHPNVMSVIDMIVLGSYVVIVTEYAEGGSLNDWLKGRAKSEISFEEALKIMQGVLRGIEHLHHRGVVHRDLKPDNILLQGGIPRITDFGISRIISESTMTRQIAGSPSFMSPEAFRGNKSPQTDIWSAGVILYQILTSRLPFVGEDLYSLRESIEKDEPYPLPRNFPPAVTGIILKALQKARSDRYKSIKEMRVEVDKALRVRGKLSIGGGADSNCKSAASLNHISVDSQEITQEMRPRKISRINNGSTLTKLGIIAITATIIWFIYYFLFQTPNVTRTGDETGHVTRNLNSINFNSNVPTKDNYTDLFERLPLQVGRFTRTKIEATSNDYSHSWGAISVLEAEYSGDIQIFVSKFSKWSEALGSMQPLINSGDNGNVIPVKKRERIKNNEGTVIGELVVMQYNYEGGENNRGYLIVANGVYLYRIYSETSAQDAEDFFNAFVLDNSPTPL